MLNLNSIVGRVDNLKEGKEIDSIIGVSLSIGVIEISEGAKNEHFVTNSIE